MDKSQEAIASYQSIVSSLRKAGIKAEIYLGKGNIKKQLKYAVKRTLHDKNNSIEIILSYDKRRRLVEFIEYSPSAATRLLARSVIIETRPDAFTRIYSITDEGRTALAAHNSVGNKQKPRQ